MRPHGFTSRHTLKGLLGVAVLVLFTSQSAIHAQEPPKKEDAPTTKPADSDTSKTSSEKPTSESDRPETQEERAEAASAPDSPQRCLIARPEREQIIARIKRMRPKPAARMLSAMDPELAADLLLRLDSRRSARILDQMSPQRSAALITLLSTPPKP